MGDLPRGEDAGICACATGHARYRYCVVVGHASLGLYSTAYPADLVPSLRIMTALVRKKACRRWWLT